MKYVSANVEALNKIVPEGSTVVISWNEIICKCLSYEYDPLISLLDAMKTPGAYRVFLDIGECTYRSL